MIAHSRSSKASRLGVATVLLVAACSSQGPRGPHAIEFVTQPTTVAVGSPITPAVQLRLVNEQGEVVTSATTQVTVVLSNNPGGANLLGTTTATAVNGVVTFADLALDSPGTGYRFTAAAPGLDLVTSLPFDVTASACDEEGQTLNPGAVVSGVTSLCVTGSAGAVYAAIPYFGSSAATSTISARVVGSGIGGAGAVAASHAASRSAVPGALGGFDAVGRRDLAWERSFREQERRELMPRAGEAHAYYQALREGRMAVAATVPTDPTIGQRFQMNVAPLGGCSQGTPTFRNVRVAAISQRAIVVADTANPSGGFTDSEYASFATTFDTLIYPVVAGTFGESPPVGGHEKIVVLFTRTVNAISPPGAGDGYVGGVFNSRDLFPTADCPNSNHAGMFYVLVPDPNGEVNGNPRTKSFVSQVVPATIGHELQHLVNAARRLIIHGQQNWFEELWLNEGLSHMAEELLYYRSSGRVPRSNIGPSAILASQQQVDAYNSYMIGNLSLYDEYLRASRTTSPFGANDELRTRGATWNFLRYAADRHGGSEQALWFELVNGPTTGRSNLRTALGVDETGLVAKFRDWGISHYADDFVGGVAPQYMQPSWAWRSKYANLFTQPLTFPLAVSQLADNVPGSFVLAAGASAIFRFTVPAGSSAMVRLTNVDGATIPTGSPLTMSVIRVQ